MGSKIRGKEYPTVHYACIWETGTTRKVNEDSLLARSVLTERGEVIIACVCDGMGGMGNGEKASGYAVEKIEQWFVEDLLPAISRGASASIIKGKGIRIFRSINQDLFAHTMEKGEKLGTTASLILLYGKKYYLFHLGDSRILKITGNPTIPGKKVMQPWVRQLTRDHSVNEHTLTRCLGLNKKGTPDYREGSFGKRTSFLVCSDGFRHIYGNKEIAGILNPVEIRDSHVLKRRITEIAHRSMARGEKDNISAVAVCFPERRMVWEENEEK